MSTKPTIPDLPVVDTEPRALRRFLDSVREIIQTREGRRGQPQDKGVTFRELLDLGIVERTASGRWYIGGGIGSVGPPGPPGVPGPPGTPYIPDYTAPPAPTGLSAVSLFRGAIVEWDAPVYTVGHGNAYTTIYAAQYGGSGPLPTFAGALPIGQADGATTMYLHDAAMGAKLHFWATFTTADDVEGPPAGGINGVQVTIGTVGNSDLGPLIIEAGNLADGSVTASKVAALAIDSTKFANGIQPVTIVSSVPGSLVTQTIFNTADKKLYRWNGSAYIATIPASDLSTQIVAGQIAANAITAGTIAADAVTAGTIAAAAINAREIAAGAVTTNKLLVTGAGSAINSDPNTVDASAWTGPAFTIVSDATSPTGSAFSSSTATAVNLSTLIPLDGSKNYSIRMTVKRHAGGTGVLCYLVVAFYDASGAVLVGTGWPGSGSYNYFGLVAAPAPTTWTEYRHVFGPSATAKIPAGAVACKVGFLSNYGTAGTMRYTSVRLAERADYDMIVDGAILATHLAANSIAVGTAAIQNGAIVNAMIANLAVDNAKIANVSAAKLTAGSLAVGTYAQSTGFIAGTTGWIIHGNGTAEFGAASIRGQLTAAQINTNGLTIRDASGNIILNASGTGSLDWRFLASQPGPNLICNPEFANDANGVTLPQGWSGGTSGSVTVRQVFRPTSSPSYGPPWNLNAPVLYAGVDEPSEGVRWSTSDFIEINENENYTLACWARWFSVSDVHVYLGCECYDNAGGLLGYVYPTLSFSTLTATWTRYPGVIGPAGSVAWPAGTVKVKVRWLGAYNNSGTSYTGRSFATRFTFNQGTSATNSYLPFDPSAVTAYNQITAANAAVYIASAAIGWAQIGDLNINTTGAIRSGQTAYHTGVGYWMGFVSGTPKFSIGNPSGNWLRWDGTNLETNGLVITGGTLNNPTLDAFSASIGGGNISTSGGNGGYSYGSRTASASGGKSPYTYAWSTVWVRPDIQATYGFSMTTPTNATCSFGGSATNNIISARVQCVVTDANGRSATVGINIDATHGTPP